MPARRARPAPKPSQKPADPPKEPGTNLVHDDSLQGVVTYSPQMLRKNPDKLKELLASPDGTPGKDVALRVAAAAPLVDGAVKDAQEWDRLHGKAALVTKSLAEKLVRLRAIYQDKNGRPDMRGQSNEYREVASLIYQRAGFDSGKANHMQGAVRYYLGDLVREALKGPDFADGDESKYLELCDYYRYNPKGLSERRQADGGNPQLPALRLPADDMATMWTGAVMYAHKALELPTDTDLASLPDAAREDLRGELTAVRDRAEQLLSDLGDD